MNGATVKADFRCELVAHAPGRMLEFAGFVFPPEQALADGWPTGPGEVWRDAAGRPALLHFAPARWLAPTPDLDLLARVEAAERSAAGMVVDATGKWRGYSLTGPDAARVLACSIDSVAVLDGRACAAVVLFDSPCVLASTTGGYAIWVRASFAVDFAAAIARLRTGS